MKKLILIIVAILSFGITKAQNAFYAGYQNLSISAGWAILGSSLNIDALVVGNDFILKEEDGIGARLAVEVNLFQESQDGTDWTVVDANIPFSVFAKCELTPYISFAAFAGPSIHLGLLNERNSLGESTSLYKQGTLSRLGLGYDFGSWFDFYDMIRVKIAYNKGLTNRSLESGGIWKEETLSISIGYIY